jgi:hypothetical protein
MRRREFITDARWHGGDLAGRGARAAAGQAAGHRVFGRGSASAWPMEASGSRFTAGRLSVRLIASPAHSQSASAGADCSQKGILRFRRGIE